MSYTIDVAWHNIFGQTDEELTDSMFGVSVTERQRLFASLAAPAWESESQQGFRQGTQLRAVRVWWGSERGATRQVAGMGSAARQ